ncbi:MAG: 23S rRNA (pseudouridine(1915)-N(3))-methyltransferase RlmH [Waddliaceae bacterium]
MKTITLFTLGKIREDWLKELIQKYLKRLKNDLSFQWVQVKSESGLLDKTKEIANVYCLDALGNTMSSEAFSELLESHLKEGNAKVAFIIGGPEGLSDEIKQKFPLISFSPMTFTSQITTLLLIEQIYRAFEISKGSKYHK